MIALYKIISTLAALLIRPGFTLYARITGKKLRGLEHHFGILPGIEKTPGQKTLWVHALSLGEVNAAAPVLKRLRKAQPGLKIVVTVTTDAGYDGARRLIECADHIFYHPLDCWPFLKSAVERIGPDLFVLVDTGFWPGLLMLLREKGVPLLLFNGRVSERSYRRYSQFKPLVKPILRSFRKLFMQNPQGVSDLVRLGARPSQVEVLGDTKIDALPTVMSPECQRIFEELRIPSAHPVWVAGSTHPGEEEVLLQAFGRLRAKHPNFSLVLAPRRIERAAEVAVAVERAGFRCLRRTQISPDSRRGHCVVVLDTMGELARVYAIAEVTFVGLSLIPPGGGHSLIEPVAHGKVVLHGPFVENVRQSAEDLNRLGVAFTVRNAGEIEQVIDRVLADSTGQAQLREKALQFVQNNKGAARRMAEVILKELA